MFRCLTDRSLVDVDGLDDTVGKHINQSLVFGGQGPYVPFPSHNFITYLGPQQALLMMDGRAERKKDQVCSPLQYDKVFARLEETILDSTEHLIVQLGVPIAYPRMVFLVSFIVSQVLRALNCVGQENMLESKIVMSLGRNMPGFVNKFNADAELLDDLVWQYIFTLKRLLTFLRLRTIIGVRELTKRSVTPSSSDCKSLLFASIFEFRSFLEMYMLRLSAYSRRSKSRRNPRLNLNRTTAICLVSPPALSSIP